MTSWLRIENLVSSKLHAQLHHRAAHRALVGLRAGVRRRQPAASPMPPMAAPGLAVPHASARPVVEFRVQVLAPVLFESHGRWPRRDHFARRGRLAGESRARPSRRNAPAKVAFTNMASQAAGRRAARRYAALARCRAPGGAGDRAEAPAARDHQRRHSSPARASRPPPDGEVLHGPLDVRADFRHQPFAAVGVPAHWSGRAYPDDRPRRPARCSRAMWRCRSRSTAGRIDNRIWLNFAGGRQVARRRKASCRATKSRCA